MEIALAVGLFLVGLVLLYFGAEGLVRGASALALRFGIAPLVVGLTVVAFGTSAPELLVSLLALYDGKGGISVGNIIGSNIANIALILGCAAMVRPLKVNLTALHRDFPVMLASTVMLTVLIWDGELSRVEAGTMAGCMVVYLGYSMVRGMRSVRGGAPDEMLDALPEELAEIDVENESVPKNLGLIVVGIAGLSAGAYLLVENAIVMAKFLKVPDLVIGISIVAIGTSLPELATSVVAAYRGESDISVGNVIGSNIFNVWMVLGIVGLLMPIVVGSEFIKIDLMVMLGVSILIWPLMRSGLSINRLEGALLVAGYLGYMVYLFLR